MKTGARFLAMLLAVVMIASAALSVSAFDDIAGNKHADAINVLSQLGILGGYEDGTFKPDQKVTRAEMAKLVYVLYTTFVDAGTAKTEFKDVKADHWATGYINWCSGKEIIGGFGDGTFAPNANVTYDQALKMVAGALGYKNWDSKLWPTDVRMKALNELKLGKELDGVDGSAELTRAQVAQIIYNAFEAPMAEKKTDVIPGLMIPVEKAKTLKEDVWGFEESTKTVTGTKNYALENGTKVDEDMIQLDGDAVALEDLGFAAYEGKTDALIGLDITVVTRNGELLSAATVSGTVVDGVKVAVSTDKKNITINGVSYKSTSENVPAIWTLDESIADEAIFNGEVVADTVANTVAAPYIARAIDTDGDGKIDAIVLASKAAYKAGKEVEVDDVKYVEYTDLAGANKQKFVASQMTATIKEGDVFVAAKISDIVYVEVVAPVEATATKINSSKVTLDTAGDVAHGTRGFASVTISDEVLGVKQNYWIYNGEIILADAIDTDTNSSYNFAILSYFNENSDRVFDAETMTFSNVYTATVVIDGKQMNVPVANEKAIDELTAAEALNTYEKILSENGYITPHNLLVTYTVDENGKYTFKTRDTSNEDYKILEEGATISFDTKSGLYVISNDSGIVTKKAIIDDVSTLFYAYTKDKTGEHQYIGTYTHSTIPESFTQTETESIMYYTVDEETGLTTIISVIVKEIIVEEEIETPDFKTDGRLLLYCYKAPQLELNPETRKTFYNQYFYKADTYDVKTNIDKDLNPTEAKFFYAYDEENNEYIKVTSDVLHTYGIECVKAYTIEDIVRGVIFTTGGEYKDGIKLDYTTKIFTFTDVDTVQELTMTDLQEMFKLAKGELDAIFFTYMDGKEKKISNIVVEYVGEKKNYRAVYEAFAGNVN